VSPAYRQERAVRLKQFHIYTYGCEMITEGAIGKEQDRAAGAKPTGDFEERELCPPKHGGMIHKQNARRHHIASA
jgi:hypothetical protein